MFVKNLTNDILTVRKSGKVLKLKPGVNCVDGFWSAEFLKSIYGPQYIICYNEEAKEEVAEVEVKKETEVEIVNPEPEIKAEDKADTEEVKEEKTETEEVKAETEEKTEVKEEKAEDTKVEVAEVKEEKTEAKKEEAKEKKATKNTAKNTTKNK